MMTGSSLEAAAEARKARAAVRRWFGCGSQEEEAASAFACASVVVAQRLEYADGSVHTSGVSIVNVAFALVVAVGYCSAAIRAAYMLADYRRW